MIITIRVMSTVVPPVGGGFHQIDQPIEDQWTYHAVAAVILANSLIRSFPQVDPNRIGVTGISWGGYLVCIVAGVDHRFKFAAPVYGCGFLGENSVWLDEFQKMGPGESQQVAQVMGSGGISSAGADADVVGGWF